MTPSLRIIARPAIDWDAIADFLATEKLSWRRTESATESESLVEFAGRTCYLSFGYKQSPRTTSEYIGNLVDHGHESVLEHASWTFHLSRVTRSFTHQFVRHRIGFSFSQLSQQYVDHSDFEMLPPVDLTRYAKAARAWGKAEQAIRTAYRELRESLSAEVPRDSFSNAKEYHRFVSTVARQVLPNSALTMLVFSANARALRHFLSLRGATEGDPEMRSVAVQIFQALVLEAPSAFSDFEICVLRDGAPAVIRRKEQ